MNGYGEIYSPPSGGKPDGNLHLLWSNAPIRTLVYDNDAEKWYAFTKDRYFELSDPIRPLPHTADIRRSWTLKQALTTGVECSKLIRPLSAQKEKEK